MPSPRELTPEELEEFRQEFLDIWTKPVVLTPEREKEIDAILEQHHRRQIREYAELQKEWQEAVRGRIFARPAKTAQEASDHEAQT